MLYDENYQLIDQGFQQVSEAAAVGKVNPSAAPEALELEVPIQEEGFLYTYLSNEPGAGSSSSLVYFDDFTVEQQSYIVQVDDYYPFGASFDQSAGRVLENRYLFQKQELQNDLGLNWYQFKWRMHDPLLGRFNSVDPLASKLPSHSPYAYGLNNPILFIDPDGQYPWPFHVRSFISTATTGGGLFRGDGRGPSLASYPAATSRVRSSFTVDPAQGYVSNPTFESDFTLFYGSPGPTPGSRISPMAERGTPTALINDRSFSEGSASFNFHHFGKDPITPEIVTPNLDVHSALTVTEDLEKGVLSITGSFSGDKFPSTEAFVVDQSGNSKIFLGAQKEDGGLHSLFGDNKKSLFNVNLQVQFDDKGNFTGVQQGKQTYSVEDWNKRVQDGF